MIDSPVAGTYTIHLGRTGQTFTQDFALLTSSGSSSARTLFVDAENSGSSPNGTVSNPFATIADALAVGGAGTRVHVAPGTYVENIVLPDDVWLEGSSPNNTSISGGESGNHVIVAGNNSVISGLMVVDSGTNNPYRWAGVYVPDNASVVIRNSIFNNNDFGVYVDWGGAAEIINNTIHANHSGIEALDATLTIVNNTITGCFTGIYVMGNTTSYLSHNNLWNNFPNQDYFGVEQGEGDIQQNPQFQDASNRAYVLDLLSPLVDAGDPEYSSTAEPGASAECIDIGAFGNTQDASGPLVSPFMVAPDDGTSERSAYQETVGDAVALHLTVPHLPFHIEKVFVNIVNYESDPTRELVLQLFGDGGTESPIQGPIEPLSPQVPLSSGAITYSNGNSWVEVDLSEYDLVVEDSDLFVSLIWNTSNQPEVGVDLSRPEELRTWIFENGEWQLLADAYPQFSDQNIMVRVLGTLGENVQLETLTYDDGVPERDGYQQIPGDAIALRITPESYPFALDALLLNFVTWSSIPGSPQDELVLHLYSGTENGPSELLSDQRITFGRDKLAAVNENEWLLVDLSSSELVITEGDIFASLQWITPNSPSIGIDTSPPNEGRTWLFENAEWQLLGDLYPQAVDDQAMIRLLGHGPETPQFTSTPTTSAYVNTEYNYNIIATDEDVGDTLTITGTPAWLTLTDHGDGTATLTGTPTLNDVGDHEVTLTVTDSHGLTDTQAFTIEVTQRTLPLDAKSKAQFTDANGDLVTVTLKGSGTGTLYFAMQGNCDMEQIVLTGTTTKSSLTIAAKGSGTTVNDVIVHGSLKSLTAKTMDLLGDITIDGTIKTLVMDDVAYDHVIDIGASADSKATVTLTFDQVADLAVTSLTPIKTFTACEWIGGSLTTPWISSLSIKGNSRAGISGDLEADITLTGADSKGIALNRLTVAGKIDSDITANNGSVGTLTACQWDEGSLNVQWIKTLTTKSCKPNTKYGIAALAGDMGADVTLTGADAKGISLNSAKIAGQITGGTWDITGHVSSIKALSTHDNWKLDAEGSVKTLYASAGLAGMVSALWFSKISTKGALAANVSTTGSDAKDVSIGTLQAGSVEDVSLTVNGGIKTVKVYEWQAGDIEAAWITTLQTTGYKKTGIAGDLGADVTVTGSNSKGVALNKLTVAGTLDGSRVCCEGDISTITVGAIEGSDILVGVNVDVAYPGRYVTDSRDFLATQGQIKSFTVKGLKSAKNADHFVDSNVSAYKIGKAKLVNLESTNNGEDFGFWIMDIGSLSNKSTVNRQDTFTWTKKKGTIPNQKDDFCVDMGLLMAVPGSPDLVASSITVSDTTVDPGQSVTVSWTAKNQGASSTSLSPDGTSQQGVVWSTDSTISDSDGLLGRESLDVMASGSTSSESRSVTIPTDATPGSSYWIGVVADYDGDVSESDLDELNNASGTAIEVTVNVVSKPDLVAYGISVSDTTADPGQLVTVSWTAKNQGASSTSMSPDGTSQQGVIWSTDSTISDSDGLLGRESLDVMASGSTFSESRSVTIPTDATPGSSYWIGVVVDYDGDVSESELDELNNASGTAIEVTVNVVSKPDLVVSAVTGTASSYDVGERINVTAYITNEGDGIAGSSDLRYYLGTFSNKTMEPIEQGSIDSLDPDETQSDRINWLGYRVPSNLSPFTTYYIWVQADSSDDIDEGIESNNWNRSNGFTIRSV